MEAGEKTDPAQEYARFIQITRKHQANREKQKRLASKSKPELTDEYYIDISQLDTLTQDNLVNVPSKEDDSNDSGAEQVEKLVKLYGSQDSFERIRSMEMNIDEHFKRKCKELSPYYWPVIPINTKPYLSPLRR